MTARRPALLTLCAPALATAVAAPPAHAARKVCHLLGPVARGTRQSAYRSGLRIRSADIASNSRELTAVIRVEDVADPVASTGKRELTFYFSRSVEENYALELVAEPTGAVAARLATVDIPFDPHKNDVVVATATYLASAKGVLDTAKDEARITVPMSAFRKNSAQMRPGRTITYLGAATTVVWGVDRSAVPVPDGVPTGAGTDVDWAYGSDRISYRLGAASCVTVGR